LVAAVQFKIFKFKLLASHFIHFIHFISVILRVAVVTESLVVLLQRVDLFSPRLGWIAAAAPIQVSLCNSNSLIVTAVFVPLLFQGLFPLLVNNVFDGLLSFFVFGSLLLYFTQLQGYRLGFTPGIAVGVVGVGCVRLIGLIGLIRLVIGVFILSILLISPVFVIVSTVCHLLAGLVGREDHFFY